MMLTFASLTFILVAFLSTFFIALYFYFTRNFKFWQKLGIPYVKPTPFVGNLKESVFQKVHIGEQLRQIYNEHSDKSYVGIFSFDKPSLLIRDPELVKNILVKDAQNFIDHNMHLSEKRDPIFSRVMFLCKGQHWRHLRTNLSPVFTSGKMKMMFYLVNTCGKELADFLHKATADGSSVDVAETMYRYTTDVIASCACGINGHSLQDPQAEFRHYLRNAFEFSVWKGFVGLTSFFAPEITSLLKLKYLDEGTENYFRKTVWSTVEYREKNGVVRNDFLDCMMELRNRGKNHVQENNLPAQDPKDATFQIDGDMFVAQAFQFLAAGFETSGTTLSYALYELALHPDIQHRLRAEVLRVLNKHNGQLTYDGMQEMSYMDRVVSETLRKYPILPFLDRICSSDYKLPSLSGDGTIVLPAGTGVYISVLGYHNDPNYFPDPEKFDPDRFTEENKRSQRNYTYLPFGEGPRICIGMRFAFMEIKSGLCHILPRFEVAPCKDTPVPVVFDTKSFLLTSNTEIPLSFTRTQQ